MSIDDHLRLASAVRNLGCGWALSYDDHPRVRSMYAGCNFEDINVTYTNATNARGHRPKNREVVITPPLPLEKENPCR